MFKEDFMFFWELTRLTVTLMGLDQRFASLSNTQSWLLGTGQTIPIRRGLRWKFMQLFTWTKKMPALAGTNGHKPVDGQETHVCGLGDAAVAGEGGTLSPQQRRLRNLLPGSSVWTI